MVIRSLADLRGGSTSRSPRGHGTSFRWRYPTEPVWDLPTSFFRDRYSLSRNSQPINKPEGSHRYPM